MARQKRTDTNSTSNSTRKRIRDLTRLLDRAEKLPADVRLNHERERLSLQHDLEQKKEKSADSRIIKKYHGIRFFERQKATRFLKKAERRLAGCNSGSERDVLEDEVRKRQIDLSYTTHYPLYQPYSSLFANVQKAKGLEENTTGSEDAVPSRDNDMWRRVEKALQDGTLEQLRNSRPQPKSSLPASNLTKTNKSASRLNTTKTTHMTNHLVNDKEEAQDGLGFFES